MTAPAAAAASGGAAPAQLLRAAHGGPALAVTAVTALLASAGGLATGTVLLVTAAVLAGQLTIGWGNDLVDAARDRQVGRTDKPLATGRLSRDTVVVALAVAALACLILSLAMGWRAGVVHLVLGVGAGQAYNLGLKATAWSWLPYAVAFGALPAWVTLADSPPGWPPLWLVAVGAALGVGAHFLNTLPDLLDDERTGVRGLPHRLGERRSRLVAVVLLVGASAVAVAGPVGPAGPWAWLALGVVTVLGTVALLGRGRLPFRVAVLIALVDVVLLVVAG